LEKAMPSMKAVLDIEQIKGVLPHRCGGVTWLLIHAMHVFAP
jgi:hypothetical protein